MRVAIIENMAGTPHGQIGVALREAAADIHVIRAYAGDPLPEDADDHDALVVLGGEQNAVDDVLYPYLPDLALLMKAFGDAGKAVMGVCLGSQLLARAYGGENILSGPPEFGWQDVSLTPEGLSDPLLAGQQQNFPIFQWHCDTFTLPPDATRLATNAATQNQAFSYRTGGLWHRIPFRGFHRGCRRMVSEISGFRRKNVARLAGKLR